MSRGAQNFRQADLTKAVKALLKAGLTVERVEIAEGKFVLMTNRGGPDEPGVNEWDNVK